MIFVAVGTQKFQFNRLLKLIDRLIEDNCLYDSVYAQIGYSDYRPRNYAYSEFLGNEEFDDYIRNCNLLITHSGVATIIKGLMCSKPVIVVPRRAKYGEHIDDHQIQIANSFSAQNLIMMCGESDDLSIMIDQIKKHSFAQYISSREKIIYTIREYISKYE